MKIEDLRHSNLNTLPLRKSSGESIKYDSILVIPLRKRHDSGYARICIVGCVDDNCIERVTCHSDDLNWHIAEYNCPEALRYCTAPLRSDAIGRSSILHFWTRGYFEVGESLPSIDIRVFHKGEAWERWRAKVRKSGQTLTFDVPVDSGEGTPQEQAGAKAGYDKGFFVLADADVWASDTTGAASPRKRKRNLHGRVRN